MFIKTAPKTNLSILFYTCVLSIFFITYTGLIGRAEGFEALGAVDTSVNAYIDIDHDSLVQIDNESSEVGLWRDIQIRVTDRDGNPMSGRSLVIYSEPSSFTEIEQPLATDSDGRAEGRFRASLTGIYIIKVKDVTFPNEIFLNSFVVSYVAPIPTPVLNTLPLYSKGSEVEVVWSPVTGLGSPYTYQLQLSDDDGFTNVVESIDGLSSSSYVFIGLENSKIYYYRVRAVNSVGILGPWSEIVFSAQDYSPPVIKVVEPPKLVSTGTGVQVVFRLSITENLSIDSVAVYCMEEGGRRECGEVSNNGNIYTVTISSVELKNGLFTGLKGEYRFCVDATDKAGHTSSFCDLSISIDDSTHLPPSEPSEIITYILGRVTDFVRTLDLLVVAFLSQFGSLALAVFSTTSLLIVFLMSFVTFFGSIAVFPFVIKRVFQKIMSFLGLIGSTKLLGKVFSSSTGEGIHFAVISVYTGSNRFIKRVVSDRNGDFYLDLKEGRYRLTVSRFGYIFPSILSKGSDEYRGGTFRINKDGKGYVSVPLDLQFGSRSRDGYLWFVNVYRYIKYLSVMILLSGLITSLYLVRTDLSFASVFILLLYIPITAFYSWVLFSGRYIEKV